MWKVVMGFREGFLLGAVLLFLCGILCVATQNQFNISNNEIMNQLPHVKTSLQVLTSPQTADQRRDLGHSPVTYQLRSNQLRNPALSKQKLLQPAVEPTFQSLQGSQTRELTSDQVVVKFEERVPVSADSVVVHCGEGEVTMQVKQNFLGNGQFIHPGDLTLGGCTALHVADNILQFQAELHGCGSTMSMTEDVLIYTFSLMYFPRPIGNTFILKTNPAEVLIECHYQRRQHVSSNAMTPTWKPFASNVSAQQQLHFSLHLMTEDWKSPRASSVYNLSDMMHVEVSVRHGHHVPMRVYADSCVSTESPNPYSQPRYAIIRSHGCLTNAKLTGAKSYFMQRSQEDKLQFQLKAFKFHQDPRNSLYITCFLKATTVSVPISSQHKACSFLNEANRWVASGGDNKVCSCCETSCSEQRLKRSLPADVGLSPALQWEETASLGPILLENNPWLTKLSEIPQEPASMLQTHVVIQAASHPSITLLCGGVAVLAVMLAIMCAVISTRLQHKPIGHSVCTWF
ncbi:hypothetical protein Q8A73_023039 [Channa argus]|nr:hypothetical protein Q8A73_023039 [Channa argus]